MECLAGPPSVVDSTGASRLLLGSLEVALIILHDGNLQECLNHETAQSSAVNAGPSLKPMSFPTRLVHCSSYPVSRLPQFPAISAIQSRTAPEGGENLAFKLLSKLRKDLQLHWLACFWKVVAPSPCLGPFLVRANGHLW
jgi:hypothetical protein